MRCSSSDGFTTDPSAPTGERQGPASNPASNTVLLALLARRPSVQLGETDARDVVEERLRWARPRHDVEQHLRRGRATPEAARSMDELANPLIARARHAQTLRLGAHASARLC